ncbi:MAG: hypothetical protein Q7R41_09485 [Phycisphaerales bacterium]|nr:hypothetical protein [Phycisphaerales bacterium]
MMNPFHRDSKIELKPGDVVFIGEGGDECAVLKSVTQGWHPEPVFLTRNDRDEQLKKLKWEEQFRLFIQQAFMRRISAIGLLFDAEPNRSARKSLIEKMFAAAELSCPRAANQVRATSKNGAKIKTAYFINPPSKKTGCLESLFVPQIKNADVGLCITDLLKCYQRKATILPNRDKLLVRTFLARRNPDNTGLTVALRDGSLSCDSKDFDSLRQFVEHLKPPETPLLNGVAKGALGEK